MAGAKPVMVQDYLTCCFENIARPLHDAAMEHGITHLIRGQRNADEHKSTARDGSVVEGGITYLQPIEDWSSDEVLLYVARHIDLPVHFGLKHTSMDCYDCTAYQAEGADRVEFMRERHPQLFAEYQDRLQGLNAALSQSLGQQFEGAT